MTALKLRTFRIGEPRKTGEGLRLGTVRLLPRGIRKEDYAKRDQFDLWFPLLSPSRELMRWFLKGPRTDARFRTFAQRYRREMSATDPRQAIALIAALAQSMPIAIGCYCDNPKCHRFVLEKLIADAR
jgi:uncharacterized protein YeaO (DUF488 family)